jgi:hypothetical protein
MLADLLVQLCQLNVMMQVKLHLIAYKPLKVHVLLSVVHASKRLVTQLLSVLHLTLMENVQPIFQHAQLQELEDVKLELHVLHINQLFNAKIVHQENASGIQLH